MMHTTKNMITEMYRRSVEEVHIIISNCLLQFKVNCVYISKSLWIKASAK